MVGALHRRVLPISLLGSLLLSLPEPVCGQQEDSLRLIYQIDCPASSRLQTDRLQQLYLWDGIGELLKYDKQGKLEFRYSNRTLGQPSRIDTRDPFNVLLYFPDFQTIVLLDRTLQPTAEINLSTLGYNDVPVVATSRDQQVWIYDWINFRLKKINSQGRLITEGQNLGIVLRQAINPTELLVGVDALYLWDPDLGLLFFDPFGQYQRRVGLPAGKKLDWQNELIYFQQRDSLLRYRPGWDEPRPLRLPAKTQPYDQLLINTGRVYRIHQGQMQCYEIDSSAQK